MLKIKTSTPDYRVFFVLLGSFILLGGGFEHSSWAQPAPKTDREGEEAEASLSSLDHDCLRNIIPRLDMKTLSACHRVNRELHQLISDPLFSHELRRMRKDGLSDVPLLLAQEYLGRLKDRYPSNAIRIRFQNADQVEEFLQDPQSQDYTQMALDFSEIPSAHFLNPPILTPLRTWDHLEELTLSLQALSFQETDESPRRPWLIHLLHSLRTPESSLRRLQVFEKSRSLTRSETESHYLSEQVSFEELQGISNLKSLEEFSRYHWIVGPPLEEGNPASLNIHPQVKLGAGAKVTLRREGVLTHPPQLSWIQKADQNQNPPLGWVVQAIQQGLVRVLTYRHSREAPYVDSPLLQDIHEMSSQRMEELYQIEYSDALVETGRWKEEPFPPESLPSIFRHIRFDLSYWPGQPSTNER
ncbi:MAG: hypothetical protein ACO3A2_10585 [Bdellovibrionia bacterium]